MKIGSFLKGIQQGWRCKTLVHNEVGLSSGVEIIGDIRLTDRKDIHAFQLHASGIPVIRILFEPHLIIDPPGLEQISPVSNQMLRFHPVIAIFRNDVGSDGIEGWEGAEVEKVWCWLLERHPERRFIQSLHTNL